MKDADHQLIRSFAHDVRNALAVIRANAQRLQLKVKNHPDPTVDQSIKKIDEKVDTIVDQVDALYDALGIQKGK